MPSVYFNQTSHAVTTEQVGSGSAGAPHVIMGWVKSVSGGGRTLNPILGSFRISGTTDEFEGNVGYSTAGTTPGSNTGRGSVVLGVTYWSTTTRANLQFPDMTAWYYAVLQIGSGSNGVVGLKLFADDAELTKVIDLRYSGYPFMTTPERYFGISGGPDASGVVFSNGTKFNYLRTFVSGAFSDAQCRAQAVSRTPVSHPSAVLWESWPLTSPIFTGEVNGRVLTLTSASTAIPAPRTDPDQPFTFIRGDITSTVPASGSTTIISEAGRNSFVIR
jgi:hypothetical protein